MSIGNAITFGDANIWHELMNCDGISPNHDHCKMSIIVLRNPVRLLLQFLLAMLQLDALRTMIQALC
jgi:hypothetical protein